MSELVNVFIVTRSINTPNKLLWEGVPIDDARLLCSSPETAGDHWMMVWSKEGELGMLSTQRIEDDGRFDELIKELGIDKNRWAS